MFHGKQLRLVPSIKKHESPTTKKVDKQYTVKGKNNGPLLNKGYTFSSGDVVKCLENKVISISRYTSKSCYTKKKGVG